MSKQLNLYIKSFSYKIGLPNSVDQHGGGFVFDCRCLPNPGREEQYKKLTGKDLEVQKYLANQVEAQTFWSSVSALVDLAVSSYQKRGFESLTVCFGCTGGQHRSVYFAEQLAKKWQTVANIKVQLTHRELEKPI